MSGVSMSMLKESERLKQMERHSMMKESERLKQMGKEIHQVEYNGWNNQNKTCLMPTLFEKDIQKQRPRI